MCRRRRRGGAAACRPRLTQQATLVRSVSINGTNPQQRSGVLPSLPEAADAPPELVLLFLREIDGTGNDPAQGAYEFERCVGHVALRIFLTVLPDELQGRSCIGW
jgi:hypothetical protein